MKNSSSILTRCTVERMDGTFCDSPVMPEAPITVCGFHARKFYKWIQEVMNDALYLPRRPEDKPGGANWTAREADHKKAVQAQSVVYYVRIHNYIKIGYTTNVRARMSQLRADVSDVLATEPGGKDLELSRHKQFADLRIGARENFKADKRLMAHIEAVKDFHGEPNITTYVPNYPLPR
jgi:hypothetical protein